MRTFFKDYLTEVAKLTMNLVDAVAYGTLFGVFSFCAFFTFATLYGWAK